MFPCGRQLDLLWGQTAHHRQPGSSARQGPIQKAGAVFDVKHFIPNTPDLAFIALLFPLAMRSDLIGGLAEQLRSREKKNLFRKRLVLDGPQDVHVSTGGCEYLAFCSNDYLGLANHPQLIAAACAGARRYGVGAGASHLISGHSSAHHALEEALACFTGFPKALLFSTGYMANAGVAAALVGRTGAVFGDKLNHASL